MLFRSTWSTRDSSINSPKTDGMPPYSTTASVNALSVYTYDFDSETDGCVTVRFRDSMEQERVAIADLDAYFADKFEF